MPGGVLATSGEVGKASEEACGVLTVSNKIAPAVRQLINIEYIAPIVRDAININIYGNS